ncbi:hypothetical protein F4779DRAFT_605250 [Xylariaceae sp. FL0662B]|nr:hypothetical protein F4779DRAFT_605250 [Xylariaceae sp. FL0662B]
MLADVLSSLSSDANDSEGVLQLVVTALGSDGQHYICWKTNSGEFRQRSHGLPKLLESWLFPADGSTRDFETLQVVLSGGDTFWASDRHGEVRSESSGPDQRLRALTFSDESSSSAAKRRWSRVRVFAKDAERPRSTTLPSSSSTAERQSQGSLLRPEAGHNRSPSADKLRRISAVPLNLNQRRSRMIRPKSIGDNASSEELGAVKEQPTPRHARAMSTNLSSVRSSRPQPCSCGCHELAAKATATASDTKPKTVYSDASVQTEPSLDPETGFDELPSRRRHRRRRSSSATIDSFDSSYPNSQRLSIDTTITQPDPPYLESKWQWQPVNPIMMGRMQDYFRSASYTLGNALQPQGMG